LGSVYHKKKKSPCNRKIGSYAGGLINRWEKVGEILQKIRERKRKIHLNLAAADKSFCPKTRALKKSDVLFLFRAC